MRLLRLNFILLPLSFATASVAAVQMEFKDDVRLSSAEFTLGDVAEVHTDDPGLANELAELILGGAPRPGISLALTQFVVSARLERLYPGVAAQIEWRGKPMVRVVGGGVEHDGAEVVKTAKRLLMSDLRQRFPDAEIEVAHTGRSLLLLTPPGEVSYTFRVPGSKRLNARVRVWADVLVDGKPDQTVPLWFAVAAYSSVAVARQTIPALTAVESSGILYERRDIAGLPGIVIAGEFPDRHRTRRTVFAGEVILLESLQPVPHVREGDLVTVVARHGQVELSVDARALGDGNIDDEILVESLSSHATYSAVVSGERLARVE